MRKIQIIFVFVFSMSAVSFAQSPRVADFTLNDISGKPVSLHDYKGKTIVINFWAAWCTACEEEVPQLVKLKSQYAGDASVIFLGINAGDSDRAAQRFVQRTSYPFLVLLDRDKEVAKRLGVTGVPMSLIVSPVGEVVYKKSEPPLTLAHAPH